MKKLSILVCLAVFTAYAALPDGTIQLAWDPPASPVVIGDVDSFTIYYSYNAAVAITNWTKATNFPAVVSGAWITNQWVTIPTAGKCFFFITSSNFWGDSLSWSSVSNITNTPSVGGNPVKLIIKSR